MEIAAEPELSVLFALARILNPRAQLADDGHADATVHYAIEGTPPTVLREALAAAGATLERGARTEVLGPGSAYEVSLLADRSFAELARRTAKRVGVRDLAIALRWSL